MGTNTTAHSVRSLPWQAVHYLRKTINFNDTDISTGSPFAQYLPAGASILFTNVKIKTAFNAVTTNVVTVGVNASYNDIVAAADVNEGATGSTMVLRGADLTISEDSLPFVKYTQTGTAATTGAAEITIVFTINNDQ